MDLKNDKDLETFFNFHYMVMEGKAKALEKLTVDEIFMKCIHGSAHEYRRVLSSIQSNLTPDEDHKISEFTEAIRRIELKFVDRNNLAFKCMELIENTILSE